MDSIVSGKMLIFFLKGSVMLLKRLRDAFSDAFKMTALVQGFMASENPGTTPAMVMGVCAAMLASTPVTLY